ncbi:patatin-like phospholipase family protein [Lyngbya aestuarii BL J]|uniref:Patatin-like phospholipase family protein n=1 Tax=Lyngbya aestuarii BL J TaxID=1348334 RepID=U7QI16_9CYAN|nr:patatin-like phospholipase family protein [Lyngbya aestuarii]ERT06730.1 patatin-like phospholipase family protein [Lyngbya aestuarii BL J]
MKSILSIDGGGIRGIIPLKVLEYIEGKTNKPIHELFDVIGGTSTGGIIALGLNSKSSNTEAIYSAKDLLKFYTEDAGEIFQEAKREYIELEEKVEADDKLGNPGFRHSTYSSKGIEKYLKEKFGSDTKMSELQPKPDVSVFSYDIQNDCPYYFNSKKARENPNFDDYCVWQAARATSAAPTFFPTARFPEKSNSIFVDGGVYINNPALALLIQAKHLYPYEQKFLLISLGTGSLKVARDLKDAGILGWMISHPGALLDVMMKGASETTHQQLQELVSGNSNSGLKIPSLNQYERYQKELQENIAMDDIKPKTLTKLVNLGEALVNENKNELNELCEVLVKIK